MVSQAVDLGLDRMALTDRDNLYGLYPFLAAARARGIVPLVGAEITVPGQGDSPSTLIFVRDRSGYETLCRVLTRRRLDGPDFSLLAGLAACEGGVHLVTDDPCLLAGAVEILGRDYAWAGLQRPQSPLGRQRVLYRRARELGAGVVALAPAAFHESQRFQLHRTLVASGRRALRSQILPSETARPQDRLRSADEMAILFADIPVAVRNTLVLADGCAPAVPSGSPIFPDPGLSPGDTAAGRLRRECLAGLVRRYGSASGRPRERLTQELDVIEALGFPSYFLTVSEIVAFARDRSIPVVGRGSGASSLVAYALGVTNVDPLRYELRFERFLHEKRKDLPDLDIDLCWLGRDEVIDFVYRRFGREKVAMISTHNCFRPRSAFREAARAFGEPTQRVNRYAKLIPSFFDGTLEEALASPRCRPIPRGREPYRSILRHAAALEGLPRHLGIHCGGVVLGDRALERYVPLERASKGIVVTQFEMHAIETVGLIKFDLLGNRALTTIRHTVDAVREAYGGIAAVDDLPEHDEGAAALLRQGQTLGCFQIESPAMRNLLRQLKVNDCDGLIDALSLVRPGPAGSGMKELYIRRRRGIEKTRHVHPRLEPILRSRYGIFLYEEDVIAAACAVGGLSPADADMMRRRIKAAEGEHEMAQIRDEFLACARDDGVPDAGPVWEQMARFARYSFCRAHASGYGVLAFQSAVLKARYPAAYWVSALNNHAGMYPKRVHLGEARRAGLEIRPPCVNQSAWGFTLEARKGQNPAATVRDGALRVGLGRVKGLHRKTFQVLMRERKARPFRSLGDFLDRVAPSVPETEALLLSGAFGFTGLTRPELFWVLRSHAKGTREVGLFAGIPDRRIGLPEYPLARVVEIEGAVLGLFLSGHPAALARPAVVGATTAADAAARPGRTVRVVGVLAASRRTRTKHQETMQFITIGDETGLLECTIFPTTHHTRLDGPGPYVVSGKVEDAYTARNLVVESIVKAPLP
jgi:DNA-directed DNA polymerase III PolC